MRRFALRSEAWAKGRKKKGRIECSSSKEREKERYTHYDLYGTISKFWVIVVCPSVCAYKAGGNQNLYDVLYKAYRV